MSVVFSKPQWGRAARRAAALGLACGVALLGGCYVAPLQAPPAVVAVPAAPAPQPMSFSARLYPANEQAAAYGVVSGVVTNDLHGRGVFTAVIAGESFTGEATRGAGAGRGGAANGVGNRGSFLQCTYTMNSSTLGSGQCRLSNGAQFAMHVGQ